MDWAIENGFSFDQTIQYGKPLKSEQVNHPSHYNSGEIECIDAIKAALTEEELRGYLKGTAIAYIWREKHKGGDTDIQKAVWNLDYLTKRSGMSKDNEQ